jgi:primosomal protein N'
MIIGVHPLAGFDKVLHYSVPDALAATAVVGALVRIPVRKSMELGIVGRIGAPRDFPAERLRAVAEVVYPFPALPPDLLEIRDVAAPRGHRLGQDGGVPAGDRRRCEGGGGVIVLVPEVALTPQTVARLRGPGSRRSPRPPSASSGTAT